MQRHRYKVSFLLTSALYGGVIAAVLLFWDHTRSTSAVEVENSVTLQLSQFSPTPKQTPSPEPIQQEQLSEDTVSKEVEAKQDTPKEEEEVEEADLSQPAPKPLPLKPLIPIEEKPKLKPAPSVAKHTDSPKKKVERKKKRKHAKAHKRTKKPVAKKRMRERRISGGGSPKQRAAAKQHFLSRLRAKIDRAKSYPHAAKRRGIQGVVRVRFTILKSGKVSDITLKGPSLFYRSARHAIEKAFPVDTSHTHLHFPMVVNLSLRYQIR